jgi:hypothetical protein
MARGDCFSLRWLKMQVPAGFGSPVESHAAHGCDYNTPFTASTMCRAEIPNASTSSSGLPE